MADGQTVSMSATSPPDATADSELVRLIDRNLAELRSDAGPVVISVTGSVAVGKSTFADAVASLLETRHGRSTAVVSSDVFLLSNAELEPLGGPFVKGYPQSYDWDALVAFLASVRSGAPELSTPTYSHERFDVDRSVLHRFDSPDVVVIEGLNLLQSPPGGSSLSGFAHAALYLSAPAEQVEQWFVDRFAAITAADGEDPNSFYHPFAQLDPEELDATARWTWNEINLPNLVGHIEPSSANADIIVDLAADHSVAGVRAVVEPGIEVTTQRSAAPRTGDERAAVLAAPSFGAEFTDHMVICRYRDDRWGPLELVPFADLSLSPATLALHYGQSVFEALKAFRSSDAPGTSVSAGGDPTLFRPDLNAARFARSCRRLSMPELPPGAFELGCRLLVDADRDWVPTQEGAALYVRPFMFASEAHLSVRPAQEFLFVVIASPVASYFGAGVGAITVHVEREDVRASPGGTGSVKFAGNYAAGFGAHGRAGAAGHDQVLWLDAAEHRWVEELNAMNVMFVWDRGATPVLTTPPLSGTILDGVTRNSLLTLGSDAGLDVIEEPTSIDQIHAGIADGSLKEAFACGTAAVVVPIGHLADRGDLLRVGDGAAGAVTLDLRHRLLGVQQGRRRDVHGWNVSVGPITST